VPLEEFCVASSFMVSLLGFQGIEVDYPYWGGIWHWRNYSSFPCLS
jgi:hypothetical protein